jgi:hypothetical protein
VPTLCDVLPPVRRIIMVLDELKAIQSKLIG